jgi:hypothetical protein
MVSITADDAENHFCEVPVHICWFLVNSLCGVFSFSR